MVNDPGPTPSDVLHTHPNHQDAYLRHYHEQLNNRRDVNPVDPRVPSLRLESIPRNTDAISAAPAVRPDNPTAELQRVPPDFGIVRRSADLAVDNKYAPTVELQLAGDRLGIGSASQTPHIATGRAVSHL